MSDKTRSDRGPHVVVTAPGFGPDDFGTRYLADAGCRVSVVPSRRSYSEVAANMVDADAAVVSIDPFDDSVFSAAPLLKVIARTGVGTDAIDLPAATRAGVAVTTTRGANEATVADHTVALMLAAVRQVVQNDRQVREGKWNRTGPHCGWDMHSKTVGLVGLGAIGREVVRRLCGFDVSIVGCDPLVKEIEGVEMMSLRELLATADIVSLNLPLTTATAKLIGAEQFALMKPGAILVNTSRGGLVDEESLVAALTSGNLRAAALDVFVNEPPRESPLLELPNVVLSPHVGGLSAESVRAMAKRAADNVLTILDGCATGDVVNPAAFQHPRWQDTAAGRGCNDHCAEAVDRE